MSDAPAAQPDNANLPSAFMDVGMRNDRSGVLSFLKDINTVKQAYEDFQKQTGGAGKGSDERSRSTDKATESAKKLAREQQQLADKTIRLAVTEKRYGDALKLNAQEQAKAGTNARRLIDLKIQEARVTQQVTREVERERKEREKATRSPTGFTVLPRSFAGFTKSGLLQGAAAFGIATSVDDLIGKVASLTQESAQLAITAETVGRAYQTSTERAGVGADELLQKLKAASRGTVTETELQLSANKALALGVGQNAQEIADLLAIARQKGKDFGTDTAKAFEDIVTGLGRASPLILDNLGIVIDQERINKEYAKALGKTVDELTEQEKKTALVNEVLRTNSDLIRDNGQAELDKADKIARAQTRLTEAKTKFGNTSAPIQAGVVENLAGFAELLTGQFGDIQKRQSADLVASAKDYATYVATIQQANQRLGIDNPISRYFFGVPQLTEEQFAFAKSLQATNVAAEEAFASAERLASVRERLNQPAATVVIDPLNGVQATDPAVAERDAQLQRMSTRLLELASTSDQAAGTIGALIDGFRAGTISGDQLEAALDAIAFAARSQDSALKQLSSQQQQTAQTTRGLTDEQKKLVETFEQAVIQAGEQQVAAEERKNDQLADLGERYTDQVAELQERQRAAAQETQDAITEATRDGAKERAAIEQDYLDQVAKAGQAYRDAVATSDADYAKARQTLLDDQARDAAERSEREQREQAQAQQNAQLSQLQSLASFVERLNQLTRYGRGRGRSKEERSQAREAERAALAESQALFAETGDAEAAAALLAKRREQILSDIEQKREDAKLRRGAARSGSSIEAELQEEAQLRADANAAEIENIKQQARDKKTHREEEAQKVVDDNQRALDDLKAKHDEEKAQLTSNYGAQLAELKTANDKRKTEFDERQRERIAQIEQHGREQQASIAAQLKKADDEYVKAQKKIKDDYDRTLTEIRDNLDRRAKEIFTPNEQRQRELLQAFRDLATTNGEEYVKTLQGIIATAKLPVPQPGQPGFIGPVPVPGYAGSGTRGSTLTESSRAAGDKILSDQAIDQIVQGGTQTDGFNGVRDGGKHGGVDIAAKEGSPIKSPITGTVVRSTFNEAYGNYTIVEDANGDQHYFGHMQAAGPKRGTQVRRGDVIGRVGRTGDVSGPHVHYQLKRGGTTLVDPPAELERLVGTQPPRPATGSTQSTQTTKSVSPTTATPINTTFAAPGEPQRITQAQAYAPGGARSVQGQTAPVIQQNTAIVDLRGSTFGPGLSENQVKGWIKPEVERALQAKQAERQRNFQQMDASGGSRPA